MQISYNKLWKLLIDKNLKKKDLQEISGISSASINKLTKNQNVNTTTLKKICNALNCDISDIIETIETDNIIVDIELTDIDKTTKTDKTTVILNQHIKILNYERIYHRKAEEEYIPCIFEYKASDWNGWVPVKYRRTGLFIKENDTNHLFSYLNRIYEQMMPERFNEWKQQQEEFWAEKKAFVTKSFFDCLVQGGWKCSICELPHNRNFQRRIQDLKDYGYTLATNTKKYCPNCGKNTTHIILLPIERANSEGNGYENWSSPLRKRIIKVLNGIDVFEEKKNPHCLPDHKFPEIRWGKNTKQNDLSNLSDDEIRQKLQLLSNQRNEQKREVCRTCYQTGKRGTLYGIKFYYKGNENWDSTIPTEGKEAENGCIGCPWYDIQEWKKNLNQKLEKNND